MRELKSGRNTNIVSWPEEIGIFPYKRSLDMLKIIEYIYNMCILKSSCNCESGKLEQSFIMVKSITYHPSKLHFLNFLLTAKSFYLWCYRKFKFCVKSLLRKNSDLYRSDIKLYFYLFLKWVGFFKWKTNYIHGIIVKLKKDEHIWEAKVY